MADRHDDTVYNAADLLKALYDDAGTIFIRGSLASALIYGRLCYKVLKVSAVLLCFFMLLSFVSFSVFFPLSLVACGLIAVSSLPLIFLRFAGVRTSLIKEVRRRYHTARFSPEKRELFLIHRGNRHGMGISDIAWIRKYKRSVLQRLKKAESDKKE